MASCSWTSSTCTRNLCGATATVLRAVRGHDQQRRRTRTEPLRAGSRRGVAIDEGRGGWPEKPDLVPANELLQCSDGHPAALPLLVSTWASHSDTKLISSLSPRRSSAPPKLDYKEQETGTLRPSNPRAPGHFL